MAEFLRIARNIDTMPVLLDLQRASRLWDDYPIRGTFEGTPHAAMTDIFVRFRPRDQITGAASHQEEYRNAFWPAWHALPSLRPLVFALIAKVSAVELGSILITKLPPGAEILPHSDRGAWAPEFYNCKLYLTPAGSSISRCGGETVTMRAGEAWNQKPYAHWARALAAGSAKALSIAARADNTASYIGPNGPPALTPFGTPSQQGSRGVMHRPSRSP